MSKTDQQNGSNSGWHHASKFAKSDVFVIIDAWSCCLFRHCNWNNGKRSNHRCKSKTGQVSCIKVEDQQLACTVSTNSDHVVYGKQTPAECVGCKSVQPRFSNYVQSCVTKAGTDAHDDPNDWRVIHTTNEHRRAEQRCKCRVHANMANLCESAKRVPRPKQKSGVVRSSDSTAHECGQLFKFCTNTNKRAEYASCNQKE